MFDSSNDWHTINSSPGVSSTEIGRGFVSGMTGTRSTLSKRVSIPGSDYGLIPRIIIDIRSTSNAGIPIPRISCSFILEMIGTGAFSNPGV